jgi:hypothetical protein
MEQTQVIDTSHCTPDEINVGAGISATWHELQKCCEAHDRAGARYALETLEVMYQVVGVLIESAKILVETDHLGGEK